MKPLPPPWRTYGFSGFAVSVSEYRSDEARKVQPRDWIGTVTPSQLGFLSPPNPFSVE